MAFLEGHLHVPVQHKSCHDRLSSPRFTSMLKSASIHTLGSTTSTQRIGKGARPAPVPEALIGRPPKRFALPTVPSHFGQGPARRARLARPSRTAMSKAGNFLAGASEASADPLQLQTLPLIIGFSNAHKWPKLKGEAVLASWGSFSSCTILASAAKGCSALFSLFFWLSRMESC